MKKRLFSLLACLCMFACLCYPSHDALALNDTEEGIAPHNEPAQIYWVVTRTEYVGLTHNEKPKERIGMYQATKTGEHYFATYSCETYSEITGTVKASYYSIESVLGFKIGKKETKSNGASSATLSANEVVTAYGQPLFEKYRIYQKEVRMDQAGHKTDTGKTATCYAYKPLLPQISFTYGQ